MTIKFISKNAFPTYLGISTDLVSGSVTGTPIIGATLYTYDDSKWYVVTGVSGSYMSLSEYKEPLPNNLGDMAFQSASSIDINGGYITGVKYGTETDYTEFESDGTMVASGSASTWNDLFFPLTTAKQGQTDKPPFSTTEIAYLFPQNDTSHIMYLIVQFPHDWEIGTDIHPHVHWKQTSSGSVVFKMEYKWFDLGEEVPTNFTTYIMDEDELPYTSGSIHQLTSGSLHISGSHIEKVSSIMLVKLYRDDNTYTGNAITYQFDIHIKKDTLGSRTEYTK